MDEKNKRRYIRFTKEDDHIGRFEVPSLEGKTFAGLIINESFKGLSVVFVGNFHVEVGEQIIWHEKENVFTPCRVVWRKELDNMVHSIGLEL